MSAKEPRIFVSWSKERSKAVASLLKDWVHFVVPGTQAWMSDEDLRKGSQWARELNRELDRAAAGLIVLTPENVAEPWILFEAGVISKAVPESSCCTVLCGIRSPADVIGPLAQFHHTELKEADMRRLQKALNALLERPHEPQILDRWFNAEWEQLEKGIVAALSTKEPEPAAPVSGTERKIDELVVAVRDLARIATVKPAVHAWSALASPIEMGGQYPLIAQDSYHRRKPFDWYRLLFTDEAYAKLRQLPPDVKDWVKETVYSQGLPNKGPQGFVFVTEPLGRTVRSLGPSREGFQEATYGVRVIDIVGPGPWPGATASVPPQSSGT